MVPGPFIVFRNRGYHDFSALFPTANSITDTNIKEGYRLFSSPDGRKEVGLFQRSQHTASCYCLTLVGHSFQKTVPLSVTLTYPLLHFEVKNQHVSTGDS
jgi:hypothetical protein